MAFDVKNPSEPIGTFSSPVNGQVMTQCPNRPMVPYNNKTYKLKKGL